MKYLKILSIICLICFVFTLSACNYQNYSNAPPNNEIDYPSNNDDESKLDSEDKRGNMRIKVNNTIFEVTLENNSTVNAFYDLLPQSLNMIELNGNEKYCYLSSPLPTNSSSINVIHAGDIMLWGNNCIVIFYETFSSGYSYSKIGKINNIENLKQCLGSGSVVVDFIK